MGFECGHYLVEMNAPAESLIIRVKTLVEPKQAMAFYTKLRIDDADLRRPLLVPYFPSTKSTRNQIAATIHRFGCKMPQVNKDYATLFFEFSQIFIRNYWSDILVDSDVPEWQDFLDRTSYSGARKAYFTDLLNKMYDINRDPLIVTPFVKNVCTPAPKHARGINSYCDESKVILGPICQAVDKKTFTKDVYVKGTDPSGWSKRMRNLFGNSPIFNTDFTSMEAHHYGQYARVVNYWMMHMLRGLSGARHLRRLISRMILGTNDIKFQSIVVQICQRLMSGAFWTSSGNALLNFLFIMFMTAVIKCGRTTAEVLTSWALKNTMGLFEGDDGIFPQLAPKSAYMAIVKEMGLKLKLNEYPDFTRAGFCSITCTSNDRNVRDPIKTLRSFFALPMQYAGMRESKQLGLLRARALSYLYLFPTAPVVAPLCHAVLRDTRGHQVVNDVAVQRYLLPGLDVSDPSFQKQMRVKQNISIVERELVAEVFHVSVTDQLLIEKSFDSPPPYICNLEQFATANDIYHSREFITDNLEEWIRPSLRYKYEHVENVLNSGQVKIPRSVYRPDRLPIDTFHGVI